MTQELTLITVQRKHTETHFNQNIIMVTKLKMLTQGNNKKRPNKLKAKMFNKTHS